VNSESAAHAPSCAKTSHPEKRLSDAKRSIASAAARLIAEEGLSDFGLAQRKALRVLGLPENTPLPAHSMIDAELRLYQRLFQGDTHTERLAVQREKARELLIHLEKFNPYLTGAVLDGSAGPSAGIDIQLFTDSAKHVEIFLLNARIDFRHSAPRTNRAEAVLSFVSDGIDVNLIVYHSHLERSVFRTRDGRIRQRVKLGGLEKIIRVEEENGS
jgi:hypothetical protein